MTSVHTESISIDEEALAFAGAVVGLLIIGAQKHGVKLTHECTHEFMRDVKTLFKNRVSHRTDETRLGEKP